jgi:hypothetical protein
MTSFLARKRDNQLRSKSLRRSKLEAFQQQATPLPLPLPLNPPTSCSAYVGCEWEAVSRNVGEQALLRCKIDLGPVSVHGICICTCTAQSANSDQLPTVREHHDGPEGKTAAPCSASYASSVQLVPASRVAGSWDDYWHPAHSHAHPPLALTGLNGDSTRLPTPLD